MNCKSAELKGSVSRLDTVASFSVYKSIPFLQMTGKFTFENLDVSHKTIIIEVTFLVRIPFESCNSVHMYVLQ